MNVVSSNYKDLINTSLSLSPKFKIIIDNVEYLSNVIKSYPKISHANTKFIGGFPTKTLEMEIYDLENNLDLTNKEIEVYKGFVINGSIEYVKQGVFIPKAENITTNISTKSISLSSVQDRTQLLDDKYESELDWTEEQTHTGLEIVEEICTKKGITLASNTFNFANYSFKQPNFPETTTYREVLSRLAEIGGEIAFFNCNGDLVIKSQLITGDVIQRQRYEKLSREKEYKINTIVLGKDGIDDDIVFPETIEEDRVEFKILDNPYVDLYREEMIEEVANYIIGMSYIPYELNNVMDGYIYELNDVVEVIDKNGESFNAVVLNTSNSSRLKSIIKSEVMTSSLTNYNLAGSKKESVNQVKLQVDHINNEIKSVVSTVETIENTTNENTTIINNTYQEILNKFNDYTPTSKTLEIENSVTQLQTDTYTKTEINTKLTDGSVTKVQTMSGTFDEDGMHYAKSDAKTSSTINQAGVEVKEVNTDKELLFAGYDEEKNVSEVRTENMTVRNYLVCGTHARLEEYDGGWGLFIV